MIGRREREKGDGGGWAVAGGGAEKPTARTMQKEKRGEVDDKEAKGQKVDNRRR